MNHPAASPRTGQLALLFVVSVAMLMSEVALLRLFEHNHWHHFAGFAMSLALLGLGAAATVLSLTAERESNSGRILVAGALIQSGGILVLLWLHTQISVRPLFAAWDWTEASRLLLVDLAAFVPFFGAGLVVGKIFMAKVAAPGTIYAVNLIGAACGSLAASLALAWLEVEVVLALAALLPAAGVSLLAVAARRTVGAAMGAALLTVSGLVVWLPPETRISDFKILSQVMALPDADVVKREPGLSGTLTVVRSQSLRFAPGLSLEWQKGIPNADVAVVGSDTPVALPRTVAVGDGHHRASLSGIPFAMRPDAKSLVLGTSTWQSMVAAGMRELVWVEQDARLIRLYLQRSLLGSQNKVIRDNPFRFLVTADEKFDLILFDVLYRGGNAAGEDYLMTAQGVSAALSRLNRNGLLVFPFKLSLPPRHMPRALATVRQALSDRGVRDPAIHVGALRSIQDLLVVVSSNPLRQGDLDQLRATAKRWRFDLVWLADVREPEVNRHHQLELPVYYLSARSVFKGSAAPQDATWFSREPATVDRPYFWRSLQWERIPDFIDALGVRRALVYFDWTLIMTVAAMVASTVLAFVLILAPLKRIPTGQNEVRRSWVFLYFSSLGLGYMLLELSLFQRSILFVPQAVTAAAWVITVFLVASGLGSMSTPAPDASRATARVFAPIVVGALLSWMVLWQLEDALLAAPEMMRFAGIGAGIAPLAWALGRALPWGISRLTGDSRWTPWALGINGFASVTGAVAATLVSVQWGQPTTFLAGACCYLIAAWVAHEWSRRKPGGGRRA